MNSRGLESPEFHPSQPAGLVSVQMRSELQFSRQQIELAITFKQLGLVWEPVVGNYVYDLSDALKPSSPFQDGVYFLLNYDCFMQRVGGLDRFKELMTWLPTWNDAREILQSLLIIEV